MADRLFDPTVGALNTSLNLRLLKQNISSANLANSDTPGYKAKKVEFEDAFRNALEIGNDLRVATTNPGHIRVGIGSPLKPEIYEHRGDMESLDGNTVNRAEEMADMAQNEIMYNSSVEMLRKKLGLIRYAITEGGK